MQLVELPLRAPAFFVEACGYRGHARFVALRWMEQTGELWFTDDGHAAKGNSSVIGVLWRRDGGTAALERFRCEAAELGRAPWLVVDREQHAVLLGCASAVWRLIANHQQRRA